RRPIDERARRTADARRDERRQGAHPERLPQPTVPSPTSHGPPTGQPIDSFTVHFIAFRFQVGRSRCRHRAPRKPRARLCSAPVTRGTDTISPAARLSALQGWRENVLSSLLTVGAITAPVIVLVAVVFRSGPHTWLRPAELAAAGLGFPALRFLPGLPLRARATLAMTLCWLTGVVALTMFGFSAGAGIGVAGSGILAVVLLGRMGGLVFVGLSVAAFFVVGVLASRGELPIRAVELDPGSLRNWTRMGLTFAFLSLILTTAIDFVIRHVEET